MGIADPFRQPGGGVGDFVQRVQVMDLKDISPDLFGKHG